MRLVSNRLAMCCEIVHGICLQTAFTCRSHVSVVC